MNIFLVKQNDRILSIHKKEYNAHNALHNYRDDFLKALNKYGLPKEDTKESIGNNFYVEIIELRD